MEKIELLKVHFLPKELKEGLLYVSEEFEVAAHLCPCGCKNKVITPLEETEWTFSENGNRPTLRPSIGNWELPCKSHYWIIDGLIEWSDEWNEEQIMEGRRAEEKVRDQFYNVNNKKPSILRRFIKWLFRK